MPLPQHNVTNKTVALVGSTGGGTATLGHTDAVGLLSSVHDELRRIRIRPQPRSRRRWRRGSAGGNGDDRGEVEDEEDDVDCGEAGGCAGIRHALFVALHGGRGMDGADPRTATATLYAVGCGDGDGDDDGPGCSREDNDHNSGSDGALNDVDTASTPSHSSPLRVRTVVIGPLHTVNSIARRLDTRYLAPALQSGRISGLISVSSSPDDVNLATFQAAAARGIPVTGSGGTSLSAAVAMHGVTLVGNAGGSVATTTYTQAVSFAHALAEGWGWSYDPFRDDMMEGAEGEHAAEPGMRSVLDACLPAFVGVCLLCRLIESLLDQGGVIDRDFDATEPLSPWRWWVRFADLFVIHDAPARARLEELLQSLRSKALPTVCAVVSATTYAPKHGSVVVMASCVAATACSGSILSGLLAGWIVSTLVKRWLWGCVKRNVPATMTNVLVGGVTGSIVALAAATTGIVPVLARVTDEVRSLARGSTSSSVVLRFVRHRLLPPVVVEGWDGIPGAGFVFGCLFCYGSKVGWYHSVFLPVILIEMERGESSLWGAVDVCALVLVSAGICAADLVWPAERGSTSGSDSSSSSSLHGNAAAAAASSVSARGLRTNLMCGDFIEAAYPSMERSVIVNAAAYLAAGVSAEILCGSRPEEALSLAYLPVPLSVWLSSDRSRVEMAFLISFGISFIGAAVGNVLSSVRLLTPDEEGGKKNQ